MLIRMPRISESDRALRRQHLVDAAWRRMAVNGYSDTTVADLCDEAGVSKGAFYGYFATKQDLFLALLEEETLALNRVAAELAERPLSGAERVRRFTQAMLRVGDDPGRVQLRADLWSALAADPVVRDRFAAAVARRRAVLREWIVGSIRAGDLGLEERRANALASVLIALADGLMLHRALDPTGFRWSHIRSVLDSLIAGIDRTHLSGPGSGSSLGSPGDVV
jgi:AcrR family transcriptional regulator